jgi:hypothetical protein
MLTINKIGNPLELARDCLQRGNYASTYHARVRQVERLVRISDVHYVIENGYHEKRRDRFDIFRGRWSYSIRGKAPDKRNLRVVIYFKLEVETTVVIVTVVVLEGDPE